jgi:type IV pilus assembly protein PilP
MNRWWLFSIVCVAVAALAGDTFSQDETATPSTKTKEAVEKFKQAPSAIGKSLEAAVEAVREKLAPGGASNPKTAAPVDPLAIPEKKPERPEVPRYSPAGKRDPFLPFMVQPQARRKPRENLTPLERYDLGQLKVVGIVWNAKEPRAMVEDSAGLGYIVGVGTPIGPDEGKIKEIKSNEVVIEENYIDFYGARKTRRVSMRLASE